MSRVLLVIGIPVACFVALGLLLVGLSYVFDAALWLVYKALRRPQPQQRHVGFWMDHESAPYKGSHRPRRR